MSAKQPRDKNGKFTSKKKPAQKNPDCEPATKGYVKCIARKLVDGPMDKSNGYLCSALFWWIVAVIAMFGGARVFETTWPKMVFTVASLLMVHDIICLFIELSSSSSQEYIQKYEPPECCEHKDECGE